MFKKFLLVAALIIPMLASAQTLKVGVVDVDEIFQKLPDTNDAQTKLAEISKKYEDEYGKLNEEMQRKYDELQNMPETELPAIRERKIKDFQEYQMKVQQFEQTAAQDIQKNQQDLMAPIQMKINNAIQSVGQESGYSLLLPKFSQTVLYFGAPVDDVTGLVKAKLGIQ